MTGRHRSARLAWLAVPALAASLAWVRGRAPGESSRWLAISPDTQQYLAMIAGRGADVPFADRPLVPALAAALPLEPLEALRWISLASLVLAYAVLLVALARRGLGRPAVLLAGLAFLASTRHLFLVQNPFGPDAFGLLAMSALLWAFLEDRPLAFGAIAPIGILAREETIFAAPVFLFTRRWRAGLAIVAIAVVAYLVPRLGPGPATAVPLGYASLGDWEYWAKIYFALGPLWPLLFLGLALSASLGIRGLLPYVAAVTAGSLLSTAFAADTVRVFLPVLPVATLLAAVAFESLRERPAWLAAWALFCLASGALAMPSVVLPPPPGGLGALEDWYAAMRAPLLVVHGAGAVLAAATAWSLRARLRRGAADVIEGELAALGASWMRLRAR